ncbi:MAG: transposase, partial [Oligoflexales bacterium]
GYKLHIDTIDGDIPVSTVLTPASVHDSLASTPLEEMTSQRVNSLYSLMDAAYDSAAIKSQIRGKGKVPIVDHNPRRDEKIKMPPPEKERYKSRSSSEHVNSY